MASWMHAGRSTAIDLPQGWESLRNIDKIHLLPQLEQFCYTETIPGSLPTPVMQSLEPSDEPINENTALNLCRLGQQVCTRLEPWPCRDMIEGSCFVSGALWTPQMRNDDEKPHDIMTTTSDTFSCILRVRGERRRRCAPSAPLDFEAVLPRQQRRVVKRPRLQVAAVGCR